MMTLFPSPDETIEGNARAIREGRRSCVEVLDACLAKIDEWEPKVRAWVVVDRDGARAQASRLDEELASGTDRGPLHGIPLGIKDIIDVAGLPTAAGFGPWVDNLADRDAALVAALRNAGAVIIGKTVTTQFAWIDPPVTRNPWNLDRTPGGSSSGSAAAVATGMCLGAIGTQTGGSIVRPASFCGVCGYKPAHGAVSTEGVVPFAPTLDHPGPIARTVRDLELLFEAINQMSMLARMTEIAPEPLDAATRRALAKPPAPLPREPTLLRLRGLFDEKADPTMRAAFDRALGVLSAAGAAVYDVDHSFDDVHRRHRIIMASEAAAWHRALFAAHRDDYQPRIRALIEEGSAVAATEYIQSLNHRRKFTSDLTAALWGTLEEANFALVTPATVGPAPDPSTTGDPIFNAPWSYTGQPTISIPIGLSPDGLPLALQLVGTSFQSDDDLFQTALWCEDVLRRNQA
jgi:Asp-tRNA(Asn)/Glu-tRNA(Gln) amidotransferase A subunit family amidase